MSSFLRVGSAGIRGVVGNGLSLRHIINYSSSFASWINGEPAVIGCDTRLSTPMIKRAVTSALMAAGSDIIDAGICPAPLTRYIISQSVAGGGCIIGASHHDAGWNAIIPVNEKGANFSSTQTQTLLDINHSRQFHYSSWDKMGSIHPKEGEYDEAYLEKICEGINIEAIRKKRFKIITDTCNGSGSSLIKKFADFLNLRLISINDEFSGHLPHNPEPRPRTAYQVKALMDPVGADIGFVFNSDASRVSIVTSIGETLSEEYTYPLIAEALLAKEEKGQRVITNICTTRCLDDVVAKYKAELIKIEVGEAPAIDQMIEMKALLAGDGMGSVAFGNGVYGFDAFKSCAVILETMAETGLTSAGLVDKLPRYGIVKTSIPCQPSSAYSILNLLREEYSNSAKISDIEGIRFDWEEGWIHLRASVTEPVLRLICEWKDIQTARIKAEEMERFISRRDLR